MKSGPGEAELRATGFSELPLELIAEVFHQVSAFLSQVSLMRTRKEYWKGLRRFVKRIIVPSHLTCRHTRPSPDMTNFFRKFTSLTTLKIYTDGSIIDSLPQAKLLEKLRIPNQSQLTGVEFRLMRGLTSLDIVNCHHVKDSNLSLLTNLTKLNLRGNGRITNNTIKTLTKLTYLTMCAGKITDAALTHLINLETLKISYMSPGDITFSTIQILTNLTCISVVDCRGFSADHFYDWVKTKPVNLRSLTHISGHEEYKYQRSQNEHK